MGEYQIKLVVGEKHNSESLSEIKILMIAPCLGKFGGIESFCLALCEDILARGAMVTLLRKKVKGFTPDGSIEKNEGEVVKTENWGLLNLSYLIKKNRKGSYIHFKIKCNGNAIDELEKNESIDKKLLRFMTIKVKDFDLKTNYFSGKEDFEKEKKESRN